jgi:PilZ domain
MRWPGSLPVSKGYRVWVLFSEPGMELGEMMPKSFAFERLEKRIPMTVVVNISEPERAPGMEMAFTENVSSRGARVSSVRRWQPNERLKIESLQGDFHAQARVAYCRPQTGGFVIGLEFLEPSGRWVVNTPVGSGKPLQG